MNGFKHRNTLLQHFANPSPILTLSSISRNLGSQSDYISAVAIDPAGTIYVAGGTTSSDFPIVGPGQTGNHGQEICFLAKISADGSRILQSTYWGGSGTDEPAGMTLDPGGNIILWGKTNSIDLETAQGSQTVYGGGLSDGFVSVFSNDLSPLYSTYLGGGGEDRISSVAVDAQTRELFIAGITSSENFAAGCVGGVDCAFVSSLILENPVSAALQSQVSVGGAAAYKSGHAPGSPMPAKINARFREIRLVRRNDADDLAVMVGGECAPEGASAECNSGAVLYLLDSNLNTKQYWNISGNAPVYPAAMILDGQGRICVAGDTAASDLPLRNAVQGFSGGDSDAFVMVFDPGTTQLQLVTYLGGSNADFGAGIGLDPGGNLYVCGTTYSSDFPTQSATYQRLRGQSSAFIAGLSWAAGSSSIQLPVLPGGANDYSTLGSGGATRVGYAVLDAPSETTPYASALFTFEQNGFVVSEVGVPATPSALSSQIFIDYRPSASLKDHVDVSTGFAIVNPNDLPAAISYRLRGRDVFVVASGHGTFPAHAHTAKMIDQIADLAPDLVLPADFATGYQFGSLQIDSDHPVAVLGLRLTNNQRGEVVITTLPSSDPTAKPSSEPLYFAQFADGGGYRTAVILMNTGTSEERGSISFRGDNGAALMVQSEGVSKSSFAYTIPPGGIYRMQTDGAPSKVAVGWIQVQPDQGSAAPSGSGLFGYSVNGILVTEAGVPSQAPSTCVRLYLDRTNGHDTGVAIANPSGAPITISPTAYQPDGIVREAGGATWDGTFAIAGNGHRSGFGTDWLSWPYGRGNEFKGVMEIRSQQPFVAMALRSLVNGRGEMLYTTLPIADYLRPAPPNAIFPQIAAGGGYRTKFIFINTSGTTALTTLRLFANDGTFLPLGK